MTTLQALPLDVIPADADRYGPIPASDKPAGYVKVPGLRLRWADDAADSDVKYAYGHHTAAEINAALAGQGWHVTYLGVGWEAAYRHRFDCADPANGCTCPPAVAHTASVTAEHPGAYPVTAVRVTA